MTGLVGRLHLRTGSIELVNAGHVAPYLARNSNATPIELPVDLPLGLFPDTIYRSTKVMLENEDRLVLVTDGMLERHAAGLNLANEIRATRSLHPREAVRALADRVLEVTGGDVSDDATVVCLGWYGGHGHDRSTRHGADPARTSPASS